MLCYKCYDCIVYVHISVGKTYRYQWQSWVEIEHYSIVYFDRITAFEAL